MLLPASLAFCNIACEQNHDGMKFLTRQPPHPVLRVVGSGCAENLRTGSHALAELFGEGRERSVIDAERSQAIPRKPYRHPSRSRVP